MAAIPLGLPRARDKTFIDTDKYPHDTEMRLQLGIVGPFAAHNVDVVEEWHSVNSLWTMDRAGVSSSAGLALAAGSAAALLEAFSSSTHRRGIVLPVPLGASLIDARFYYRETAAEVLIFELWQQQATNIGGSPGDNTLLDTATTPGATTGDATITLTPSGGEFLVNSLARNYMMTVQTTQVTDEVKGFRLRYNPNNGLS